MAKPAEATDLLNPSEPEDAKSKSSPLSPSTEAIAGLDGVYWGTAEKTVQESSYVKESQLKPYNPDPLVQKAWDYRIYEEMLEDDQVSVAIQVKKDLVVGSGWHILADESQADIKDDLELCLNDGCDRPFAEMLEEIIQAYEFGFSVSEKIFKVREGGALGLKDIKTRHPGTWRLHTDKHGNMTKYEQLGQNETILADPNSLIHYVNNSKFQNPYGKSDLYPAYQAYMTKRHITRFYAIFLEKAASPTPVASYDRKAPQEAVDDIYQAIKKFQTKTALAIPKDITVEFLEAKSNGESYIKGINLFNMFIGRALFIPDLLGFQGGETAGGAYSLGREQIGLFYRHIYKRRSTLERLINQHIIKPLVIYNFGLQEKYPQFSFKALSDEDVMKNVDLWIKAVQGKSWKPTLEEVNHFRDLIKFPKSDTLEEYAPAVNPLLANPNGPEDDDSENDKNVPRGTKEKEAKADDKEKEKEEDEKEFEAHFAAFKTTPGNYHKKVDFKAADQLLKATLSRIMAEAEPVVKDIFEDMYDQIQKKKIIQSQNLEKAESISLKYLGRLQQVLKRQFRRLYQDARVQAIRELNKQEYASPIPADEFLDFLDKETFRFIGEWEYRVTSKTKQELIKAIKDGRPMSEVMSVMDDEGRRLSDESLERYARTKSTEVFNRGRKEYFEESGVVSAYQYSAILDNVTSDICAGLHGTIFEQGTEPTPPLHFNCRSVLIPITKYESYDASKKANDGQNIDKFIEENIGDGFSKN